MKILALLFCLSLTSFFSPIFASETAESLIAKADNYRGFAGESFELGITAIFYENGKEKSQNQLLVSVNDEGKTLTKFLSPARVKGRLMLYLGKNLWLRIPDTKKVIRISPAQRLIGQASNADVAAVNFLNDYDATIEKEEQENGVNLIKLLLNSKKPTNAYHQIEYWIDKKTGKPFKSLHYARSGKLLKRAFYKSYSNYDGAEKIQKLLLTDTLKKDSYTWLIYHSYKRKKIPASLFTKNFLDR